MLVPILERIPKELNFGFIVNADNIEKSLNDNGFLSLNEQNISTNTVLLQNYLRTEGFSIANGEDVELHCKTDEVPNWFIKYVINRTTGNN